MRSANTKKKAPSRSETLTLILHRRRPTYYPTRCFLYLDHDWYVPLCTIRRLEILTKKRKQNKLPGDDASTGEAAPEKLTDEKGEAGRAKTTPNGGPHLDLGRLRLKPVLNLTSRSLGRHDQRIYRIYTKRYTSTSGLELFYVAL